MRLDTPENARRAYIESHWGQRGPVDFRRLRVPDPFAAVPVELGQLVSIVYRTRKGRDRELVDYEHEFEDVLPRLCFVPSGLIIAGGDYRVEARGIVG